MGGDRGHAQAGPQVVRGVVRQRVRQRYRPAGVEHAVLGRGPVGGAVLPEVEPDPLARRQRRDIGADRVDDARAVLARRHLVKGHRPGRPGPRLPVGRVHPGPHHPHPDLTGTGLGHRTLRQLEHARRTLLGVDDRTHTSDARQVASELLNWSGTYRFTARKPIAAETVADVQRAVAAGGRVRGVLQHPRCLAPGPGWARPTRGRCRTAR